MIVGKNCDRRLLTLSVLSQFYKYNFTCSDMGALICNYLPDEVCSTGVHEFSTMNRQDGHLQFDPKRSNLRSYAHDQFAKGVVSRNGWKTNVLLISTGLVWAMQGVRLIVESVTFATTLVSLT
jgi:hypothetical protein